MSESASTAHTEITALRHDYVIDNVDAEDTPSISHAPREMDVLSARLRVTGRVVMSEHYRAGMRCYGWGEYLPSLDGHMSNRAHSNNLEGNQAEPDVKKQHGQGLAVKAPQGAEMCDS